jgi:hypothetical protein
MEFGSIKTGGTMRWHKKEDSGIFNRGERISKEAEIANYKLLGRSFLKGFKCNRCKKIEIYY